MKVLTFSMFYPAYHPQKGKHTFFPEMILNSLGVKSPHDVCEAFKPFVNDFAMLGGDEKAHTIRSGNRWKVGDWFSPRVWSGKPYASKQIEFAPPIQVKKIWDFEIKEENVLLNGAFQDSYLLNEISVNDGLDYNDLLNWFRFPKPFTGQIICWNENINY